MIHNNRFFGQAKLSGFTPTPMSFEEEEEAKKTGDTTTQPVTEGPKVLTTEEKEEKIANIIKQFVSGNMTRFEAEQELDELGINCASNDNANDRVLNFEFNNKKYQITCSRVAANDGKGGNVVEAITPEEVNAVVQKYGDDAKKYFKAVATVDGETTAYALDFTNWPEGVNKTLAALQTELAKPKESAEEKAVKEFIENYTNSETDISGNDFDNLKKLLSAAGIGYNEEQQTVFGKTLRGIEFEFRDVTYHFYTNEATANASAKDSTNISPSKFNEAQLAGIDNNAIMRYFTKQDDGTYIMNEANITADFPEAKYGKIDTPEKLKKAIADSAKADTTGSAAGASGSTGTSGANGTGGTNGAGSVTQPNDTQKSKAKYTVMTEVMKAYMSGNGDYGITTKCSDTRLPSLFSRKLSNAIDEFAKSYTGSADDYLKALQDHIKTAVPTLIQEVENEIKASDTNGAKENTPKVTTYKQTELAGLDANAISTYFTKQSDGTYVMNDAKITADFPEAKYGKIDTPEKLKKAIADSAKADTTGSAAGASGSTGTSGANGTGGTNGAGSVTQPNDTQKSKAKYTVMTEVMKAYMSGNGDYGITTKCSDTRLPSLFSRKLSNAIDEFAKSYTGSADDYLKALQDHIKTAVPTLIQEVENEIKASDTNGAKENTPKVTTYKQTELAGLDANAISTYFTKQSDGTYVMNDAKIATDFPEAKYGKIDTPEKLKKAIADATGPAGGAGNTPATQYTKEDLKNTYNLTESDIRYFFKQNGDNYEVDATATKSCFGKEINNVQDLLNAMQNEPVAIGYIYSAYSMDSDKYLQYFTVTGEGYDKKFTMNMTKIKQDFPDKNITTIGQLKAAVDAKGSTTGGTRGTNGTDGTRGTDNTTPAANDNKASDTTDKTEALKTAYKNVNKAISVVANWLGILLADTTDKINGKFDYDSSGNIDLKDSNTKTIFNNIVDKIVSEIESRDKEEFLETIGGKDGLKKLVQSAWIMAYSSYASDKTDIKTKDFVNKVMENLQKIMQNLQQNPNNLEYLTDDCYKDSDLANTSTTKLNTKEFIKYDNDGLYHLDYDTSDKNFQEAMNTMLEKLYNKYPNISKAKIRELFVKAQGEALTSAKNGTDIPAGCTLNRATYYNVIQSVEMSVKDMVQLVAYKFDKLFKTECLNSTFPAREVETKPTAAKSSQTAEQNSAISEGANGIASAVKYVKDTVVKACKGAITKNDKNNIHTEFGMDSSGNIVFQENDTKAVFDTIFSSLKSSIEAFANDALTKLGGESALKKLVQAAWIVTYNDFDSSQSNNVTNFVNKVMSNLETMINKLKTNPELFEVYTKRSSYADTSVTNNVRHYNKADTYGGDEVIDYKGAITTHTDGTVHISNTNDDNDYQTTMSDVLKNLITKYSNINSDTVTRIFRDAQKKALEACQQDKFDCPYGTGNNKGRVEDSRKDWSGANNRYGDHNKKKSTFDIHMDQLVQMTLYYFDKLLLKEMMK